MDWREVDTTHCGVAASLAVLGDRWSLLIVRDVFAGVHRFDDLQAHVGVSTAVLSDRLRTLTDAGILEPVEYREPGRRARNEYHLTDRGRDLLHVEMALAQFGADHLVEAGRHLLRYTDRETGQRVRLALVREDGTEIDAEALRMRAES